MPQGIIRDALSGSSFYTAIKSDLMNPNLDLRRERVLASTISAAEAVKGLFVLPKSINRHDYQHSYDYWTLQRMWG